MSCIGWSTMAATLLLVAGGQAWGQMNLAACWVGTTGVPQVVRSNYSALTGDLVIECN